MVKRGLLCLLLSVVLLAGCVSDWGTMHVTDPAQYGKVESYITVPACFPDVIEEYTVNAYSYTLYSYMDVCYEIFLNLTVTQEQLQTLLSDIRQLSGWREQEAWYAEGYCEIVFHDSYSLCPDSAQKTNLSNVWNARIEKVVYHPQTGHIVFESLNAFDSVVYPLSEVAFFNCFGITQERYVNHIWMTV